MEPGDPIEKAIKRKDYLKILNVEMQFEIINNSVGLFYTFYYLSVLICYVQYLIRIINKQVC